MMTFASERVFLLWPSTTLFSKTSIEMIFLVWTEEAGFLYPANYTLQSLSVFDWMLSLLIFVNVFVYLCLIECFHYCLCNCISQAEVGMQVFQVCLWQVWASVQVCLWLDECPSLCDWSTLSQTLCHTLVFVFIFAFVFVFVALKLTQFSHISNFAMAVVLVHWVLLIAISIDIYCWNIWVSHFLIENNTGETSTWHVFSSYAFFRNWEKIESECWAAPVYSEKWHGLLSL